MTIELDYFESYTTDALAQASYISNDKIDSYTKLLLYCNGADGSQTFTDETGKTITPVGNVQIDTAQSKFGGASGLFDGAGDYLSLFNSEDFTFGTGDFTIDCWVRFNTLLRIENIFAYTTSAGSVQFFKDTDGHFKIWGQVSIVLATSGESLSVGVWYHIAFVRNGDNWQIYIEGTSYANVTDARSLGSPNHANGVMIGAEVTGPSQFWDGWIDEHRVSKGIARWTSNFTPPVSEHPHLECYSEATIKQQGIYSLKVIAKQTDSLNDTLTRTVSPVIDLTGQTEIKFDIRSSRTGSNIKIGIHDSGGVTTEITPNITDANTWQTVTWDISGVANADKDNIDRIIVTIVNSDADATFYIDNMYAQQILTEATKDLIMTGQVKGFAILPMSGTVRFSATKDLTTTGQVKAQKILDMSGTVEHSDTEDLSMSGNVLQAPPEIPMGLAALDMRKGDLVRLSWTANAETNIAKYNMYYGTTSGGPYTLHGYIDGTEYYLGGLTKGIIYYFVITAVNGIDEESGHSDEVSATPTLKGGYEDEDNPGTFLPGFKAKLYLNDVNKTKEITYLITAAIINKINYTLGFTASTCSFNLPRRFDDFGEISYGDTVDVYINDKHAFNGSVRNIVPSLGSRGETVTVTAADSRVVMDGRTFEKDGRSKITYNSREPSGPTETGTITISYTEAHSIGDMIRDIWENISDLCTLDLPTEFSEFAEHPDWFHNDWPEYAPVAPHPTKEFTDATCAEAIDTALEGTKFRWYLAPDPESPQINILKVFPFEANDAWARLVNVGEFGQPASEYNVVSARLNKSYSNVVNKVVFIGGKREIQLMTLLDEDWDPTKEDDWNLDNKDDPEYKDVYRKFRIMGSTGWGLMSKLITYPWLNAVVFWRVGPWDYEIVNGFSVDYDNATVTFQEPQTRVTDMETGEVETLPLKIIYAYYGEPLQIETSPIPGDVPPYEVTKTIRDEKYIQQFAITHSEITELLGAETTRTRDDSSAATKIAEDELEKLHQPVISGDITIVGDETWESWHQISLDGCTGTHAEEYRDLSACITGWSHNLGGGFTTSFRVTTEKPLFGLERLRDEEAVHDIKGLKNRAQEVEDRLLRREGKAGTFHPHDHRDYSDDGLAFSVYSPEEAEEEE